MVTHSETDTVFGGWGWLSAVTGATGASVRQWQSDHPVSVHGNPTWLRFRVTVATAWGVTL